MSVYSQDPSSIYGPTPSGPTYSTDPASIYGSTVDTAMQDQANADLYGFNQGLYNGMIQAGPQFAMSQSAREALANQIAATQASSSLQSGYLNQDYATGLGRLGLQGDQLGIQRNNLGLDREALGLKRNSLGFDLSSLGVQLGANARQPAYLTALHELANQGFNQNAATNTRAVNSSSVARGSFGSVGQRANLSDIQSTLAQQLGGEAQRFYENMAQVGDQKQELGIQGQRIGNESKGLDLDARRLDNQNAMLDIQSKNLGLDRKALQTELERGLDRLGLSSFMSIADLTDKMNSSNIQDQLLAQQIFNQAIQNSDYYAQFYSAGPPSTVSSTNLGTVVGGAPIPGKDN